MHVLGAFQICIFMLIFPFEVFHQRPSHSNSTVHLQICLVESLACRAFLNEKGGHTYADRRKGQYPVRKTLGIANNMFAEEMMYLKHQIK